MHHAAVDVEHQDALVDRLHQLVVAHLCFAATAEVARDGDDALAAVVIETGRMHLDREPRAVGAHVGGFDDVSLAAVERLPHGVEVVARQLRVQHVDGFADNLVERRPVGRGGSLVDVEHDALGVKDGDRVGHGRTASNSAW